MPEPKHLFCLTEKRFSSSTCFAIHTKHHCCQTIRQSSLYQRGRAYSLETMAVDSKGDDNHKTKEGGGEGRETQYARNKVNINHAHAIRRTGIYSDRHVRKNKKQHVTRLHHEKLKCRSCENELSGEKSETTRLINAAISFFLCLLECSHHPGETNGSDMLSDWKSFWSWTFGFGFQSDHNILVTFQAAPCLQLL